MSDDLMTLDEVIKELEENRNWFHSWLYKKLPNGIGGMNPYYALFPKNWWKVLGFYYDIRRARRVRGKKGYDIKDTYDLDRYILSWLPDAVADLRKLGDSTPYGVDINEWHDILIQIEAGLLSGQAVYEVHDKKAQELLILEFQAAWALMGKNFFDLWY